MRYLPIRKEKSLTDITERVYGKMTVEKQKLAEAAILRENPHLKSFAKIREGALVRVPKLDDVEKAGSRSTADPVSDSVKEAREELDRFAKTMKTVFSHAMDRASKDAALAKKADFTKAMASKEESAAIAAKLKANLTKKAKDLKAQEAATQASLAKLSESLAKLDQ